MRFYTIPEPTDLILEREVEELIANIKDKKGWEGRLALDTETTKGLSITDNSVLVWSLSDGKDRWQLRPEHLFLDSFVELWEDPQRVWVFVNAKFDMHQLHLMGLPPLGGHAVDVISMAFLHDENIPSKGMGELASKYLHLKMK